MEPEVITGYADMIQHSYNLIRSVTLLALKELSLPRKQHGLDFVRLVGGKEYAAAAEPVPAFEQERTFMRAWQRMLLLLLSMYSFCHSSFCAPLSTLTGSLFTN